MHLKVKNIIFCCFKMFIYVSTVLLISCVLARICIINHELGVMYCNLLNIPEDLTLSVLSPGVVIQVAIILSCIELFLAIFIINKVKKIEVVRKICEKIFSF